MEIHDQGKVIVTLKDHAWGERRKARGNALKPIPRDGIMYETANPGSPDKAFKRRRVRNLHFVGSKGFPDGVWIGETELLAEAEHGPPWCQTTVLDVSNEEYHHLGAIARGESERWMSWADRLKDADAKQRLRGDVKKYGDVAMKAEQMGSMSEQIARAVQAELTRIEDEKKNAKEQKRISEERAKRTKNEEKALETEVMVVAERGGK